MRTNKYTLSEYLYCSSGLRAVGETDRRLIATIPRRGFQIDESVKITKRSDTENITKSHDDEKNIDSKHNDTVNLLQNMHDDKSDLSGNDSGIKMTNRTE